MGLYNAGIPLAFAPKKNVCANCENNFGEQCASKGHKLPSQHTLTAIVQKLQSSSHITPITVAFCNDATSVTREVTGQQTVVKFVLVRYSVDIDSGPAMTLLRFAQC